MTTFVKPLGSRIGTTEYDIVPAKQSTAVRIVRRLSTHLLGILYGMMSHSPFRAREPAIPRAPADAIATPASPSNKAVSVIGHDNKDIDFHLTSRSLI